MNLKRGTLPVVQPLPSIVNLASLAASSSMGSLKPTFCITTCPAFRSIMPTRPLKQSNRLWVNIIARIARMAQLGSSRACGGAQGGASGLSRPKALRVKVKASYSFATGMEMGSRLRNYPRHPRHSARPYMSKQRIRPTTSRRIHKDIFLFAHILSGFDIEKRTREKSSILEGFSMVCATFFLNCRSWVSDIV